MLRHRFPFFSASAPVPGSLWALLLWWTLMFVMSGLHSLWSFLARPSWWSPILDLLSSWLIDVMHSFIFSAVERVARGGSVNSCGYEMSHNLCEMLCYFRIWPFVSTNALPWPSIDRKSVYFPRIMKAKPLCAVWTTFPWILLQHRKTQQYLYHTYDVLSKPLRIIKWSRLAQKLEEEKKLISAQWDFHMISL